ncbi:TetR/AcrR family transcriptional regulator [Flexivirga caeni]|uniref:TetR/AcrR family transcriptional regulator n=1 Tax=Flexivirga caeni TaxID=2294115 RepID=UPI0013155F8F|nr:TetR/AcrR family transcriptional regulator [Flexivirga caeni]
MARAAIEVVATAGFPGATADAIAETAGVSKGLLWHYFDDRDALLEHAARETLVLLRRTVGSKIDLDGPVDEVIRDAIHRAATLPTTHPREVRALRDIALNLRAGDGSLRLGGGEYDETHRLQAEIFQRGVTEGTFRADLDPLPTAVLYQGLVDTMVGHLMDHPDVDAGLFADQVADLLLRGIASPA